MYEVYSTTKKNFTYKADILDKYGRIFAPENIEKYSNKIAEICNAIKKAKELF